MNAPATKRDLDAMADLLRRDFKIELAAIELTLRDRMDTQFRTTVFAVMFSLIAAISSLAGLAR